MESWFRVRNWSARRFNVLAQIRMAEIMTQALSIPGPGKQGKAHLSRWKLAGCEAGQEKVLIIGPMQMLMGEPAERAGVGSP